MLVHSLVVQKKKAIGSSDGALEITGVSINMPQFSHLGLLLATGKVFLHPQHQRCLGRRQSDGELLQDLDLPENAGHEDEYTSCCPSLMTPKLLQLVLIYPLLEKKLEKLRTNIRWAIAVTIAFVESIFG